MENNDPLSEHNESKNENLVEDLKKSLKNTIDETKDILKDFEQTVEKTIDDISISDETKKIVDSISEEITNSTIRESKNIIKNNDNLKNFSNFEEE